MIDGRVLVVAGSDSGGGAGIQADIKTVMRLGGYAMTAITSVTAQDTRGVHGTVTMPAAFVAQQMRLVLDDIGADAVKTGMLADHDIIIAVADVLASRPPLPLVIDPVMSAKGGQDLLASQALGALREVLGKLAPIVTPNLPEAELLTGRPIGSVGDMAAAGQDLLALGGAAVLVKGGHLAGDMVTDVLVQKDRVRLFTAPRLDGRHTHGTGCTLASAIAVGLAQKMDLDTAITRARAFVRAAITAAPGLGAGHGPMDHGIGLPPYAP